MYPSSIKITLLDTFFAIVRRLLKKESLAKADKEHFHHQILKRAGNQTKTVLIIYLIQILFSSASIVYVLRNPKLGQIIYIILFVIILWIVLTTNIVFDRKKIQDSFLKNSHKKK